MCGVTGGEEREAVGKKLGKRRKKSGKIGKKEEKPGRKDKNQEGSFTLPLLIDRAGYATEGKDSLSQYTSNLIVRNTFLLTKRKGNE